MVHYRSNRGCNSHSIGIGVEGRRSGRERAWPTIQHHLRVLVLYAGAWHSGAFDGAVDSKLPSDCVART